MAAILIADDDANIARALAFLMRNEGHEVRMASDGEAALASIAADPPDLVLLDVMMPKKNGYDVCRALRADSRFAGLRIVMLTAKGREADRRAGLELGVDAYLTKPFAIREVVDCVAGVLDGGTGPTRRRQAAQGR
jgi:DNA-binding response OmpR family regulator